MNFLSNVLREDGGFEYKKAIVDSILILIKDIPDAKEPGLGHLCEFIEACSLLNPTKMPEKEWHNRALLDAIADSFILLFKGHSTR